MESHEIMLEYQFDKSLDTLFSYRLNSRLSIIHNEPIRLLFAI